MLILAISYICLIALAWQGPVRDYQFSVGSIAALILLVAYLFSRTRWYETAVYVLAIGFSLNLINILRDSSNNTVFLIFFILPVMVASMVLSIKKTAVVALIEFLAIFYILVTIPAIQNFWTENALVVSFYVLIVGLLLLSKKHRNDLEQSRRDKFLQQEARLQTYFDNATDWLFALDAQGLVSSVNQIACQDLGYAAEEIIGQSPVMFLLEENQTIVEKLIQEMFQGKDIPFFEAEVQGKNGRSIWLEIRGHKLYQNNKIVGTFHIARNITDRKIAEDARTKLNNEIKILYETGRQLGQKIDLKTVYHTIYESIVTVVDFRTFIVASYFPERQELTLDFIRHLGKEWDISQYKPLSITDTNPSIQQQVIQSGESRLINDYLAEIEREQPKRDWDLENDLSPINITHSAILVPLKIDDQVQGIIEIHSEIINAFSSENLYFLEALSSHVIAAITNANLLQQSQNELIERKKAEQDARKRQALAETLQTAIAILNSSLSLEDVLDQILEQLHNAIPYDSAAIQQKEGDFLILKAARGFQDNASLVGLGFRLDANLPNAEVVRTKTPLAIDNVMESYPEFQAIASSYQAGEIYTWLGIPLIADNDVIGMITIDRNEVRPYGRDEITLATTFANHAAMAMHNAALYRELETHSEALEKAVSERTIELQRTTDQVRAILQSSPEAILFLNPDRSIQEWNPAFIDLFGYEPDKILDFPIIQLLVQEDREKFEQAMETAVSTQTTQRVDITVQSKNGNQIEVNAALAPIQEEEAPVGIVCSLHDISHFKEVERLKDAFVSNVSHELRTPITNLRLHHDLLNLNPKKHDVYMARLGREIDRLNIIIEDLLRISRLDQKRIEFVQTEIDLIKLVEQYTNDRKSSARNRQLTLSLTKEPSISTINGDARLLEQVIGALLTNAMNYTLPGGHIQITPQTKQENGLLWSGLRIHDTGLSIPETEQSQIFTRFFRGQASLDTGEPGTGLGLAIAQEIMHLHGGTIELESSSPEKGTSFIIWLPAKAQSEEATNQLTSNSPH